MRPLTAAELKLVLERGLEALPDRNAAEVVQALALEVSERRVEESETAAALRELHEKGLAIRAVDAPHVFWKAIGHAGIVLRRIAKRAAEAGIGEGGK